MQAANCRTRPIWSQLKVHVCMSLRECCRQTKGKPWWDSMKQQPMSKRSFLNCVKMPSGLPVPLLILQDFYPTSLVHCLEELWQVKNQADLFQSFHGKSIKIWESSWNLLLSAASSYDAQFVPKGDLLAPLPRHQGGMCTLMTWLIMEMMISMTPTIW